MGSRAEVLQPAIVTILNRAKRGAHAANQSMKTKINSVVLLGAAFILTSATWTMGQPTEAGTPSRPKGPCDIYAAAGDPCVAAHSTTRALYASYNGPLYRVKRQSDGKSLDIGIVQPSGSASGGYADAGAQDAFCANTYCWITTIYDQSPKHNDLTQAPRGDSAGQRWGDSTTFRWPIWLR